MPPRENPAIAVFRGRLSRRPHPLRPLFDGVLLRRVSLQGVISFACLPCARADETERAEVGQQSYHPVTPSEIGNDPSAIRSERALTIPRTHQRRSMMHRRNMLSISAITALGLA